MSWLSRGAVGSAGAACAAVAKEEQGGGQNAWEPHGCSGKEKLWDIDKKKHWELILFHRDKSGGFNLLRNSSIYLFFWLKAEEGCGVTENSPTLTNKKQNVMPWGILSYLSFAEGWKLTHMVLAGFLIHSGDLSCSKVCWLVGLFQNLWLQMIALIIKIILAVRICYLQLKRSSVN